MEKKRLFGMTIEELRNAVTELAMPKFTATQIADWIYKKGAESIEQITNLSAKNKALLSEHYEIGRRAPFSSVTSSDGTKKYLYQIGEKYIETVYIPDKDRATLCVSCQVGCKMNCKFCMTGTLGFHGHLDAGDILNQIFSIPDSDKLTNIVYMGEGEPMDNLDNVLASLSVMTSAWGCGWSPKRITVSSVGISKGLKHFVENCDCHLAISLHNPFAIERQEVMPIEKVNHLSDIISLLKQYDWSHQRRVSFEYICWSGINDTPKHANELLRLLKGLDCRINLIRFHAAPSSNLHKEVALPSSDEQQMEWLRDYLTDRGITTTIRRSRGEDILAACGMLVNALRE